MPFSPKAAADACLARSRRLLAVAQNRRPIDEELADDLCRSALVSTVAAVDTYMHWVVFQRLSHVRYEAELPKSLSKTMVPFSDLASLADSMISAQYEERRMRPWVQVKNTLQAQLLQETFQSYEQVGQAFALAGIERSWSRIAEKINNQPAQIRDRLNKLVRRRNQIVHEGDITRASRPRDIYFNEIDEAEISGDVNWIEHLIAGMQRVVDEG